MPLRVLTALVEELLGLEPRYFLVELVVHITTGWTDDGGIRTYSPSQPINRVAMAAFLYRLATGTD